MSVPSGGSHPTRFRIVTAMVVLQLMASICYPIAKHGLTIIEPYTFAFYRYLISSVVLLILARTGQTTPPIERKDWLKIFAAAVLIIPFNQTLFLVGQSMTGAGHGAFLFATTPVWVFALALIHLGEKLVIRRAIGVLVATAGVLGILVSGAADVGSLYVKGDLILLVSVAAWGYYTILGKGLVRKYGAFRITAYALSIGSALYFPFGLYHAIQFDYSQTTLAAWGSVAYMAIGLSVVVYTLWYWLLKYLEASRIAVYHNIQPVIASGLAYLFLGEPLSGAFIVGGITVIAGVLITEL